MCFTEYISLSSISCCCDTVILIKQIPEICNLSFQSQSHHLRDRRVALSCILNVHVWCSQQRINLIATLSCFIEQLDSLIYLITKRELAQLHVVHYRADSVDSLILHRRVDAKHSDSLRLEDRTQKKVLHILPALCRKALRAIHHLCYLVLSDDAFIY